MRTNKTEVRNIQKLPEPQFFSRNFPGALKDACYRGDPELVRQLLNLTDENQKPLYSASNAFFSIFERLQRTPRGLMDSFKRKYEGGLAQIYNEFDLKKIELCVRAIIQHEKEQVKLIHPDYDEDQVNKEVADKFINTSYSMGGNHWKQPFIWTLGLLGSASSLIHVISDELDVKNINFKLPYNWSPMRSMLSDYSTFNYTLVEAYLTEYIKSVYEEKEHVGIYEEIVSFFSHPNKYFTDQMKVFPKHLYNAMENAKKDLLDKYPGTFDEEKLEQATNHFEDKFMPDALELQKINRRHDRNVAIAWSFTVVGLVSWIWYALKVKNEPIKAFEPNSSAFFRYEMRNKDDGIKSETPKPLMRKAPHPGEPVEWRIRKVTKLSENDKITVFATSFNDQAKKFEQKIHLAEKEEKNSKKHMV